MRYQFLEFALDTDKRELSKGADALHLSAKAFDLLCMLVEERDRAIDKREIYDRLWPDTFVSDANLPVLIREIRRALGKNTIRTVHRFGYAFAAEVKAPTAPQRREPGPLHRLLYGEREILLRPGDNVVGRDESADVVVFSTGVSRRHATITVTGDSATVADLGSKNGTTIDGAKITAPTRLRNGCTIGFGFISMMYGRILRDTSTESLLHGSAPGGSEGTGQVD